MDLANNAEKTSYNVLIITYKKAMDPSPGPEDLIQIISSLKSLLPLIQEQENTKMCRARGPLELC